MPAHLALRIDTMVSGSSVATIYTGAPQAGVYTIAVKPLGGGPVAIGWYDSTGNTLHDSAVLDEKTPSYKFGPMAANDILVAQAYKADALVGIFEVY